MYTYVYIFIYKFHRKVMQNAYMNTNVKQRVKYFKVKYNSNVTL